MRQPTKSPGEKSVKDLKLATRKQYSSEEMIRIVWTVCSAETASLNCAAGKAFLALPPENWIV